MLPWGNENRWNTSLFLFKQDVFYNTNMPGFTETQGAQNTNHDLLIIDNR